ncbi:MAG: hypothetical protein AAF525_22190 [Pseudomonadota bacterium]
MKHVQALILQMVTVSMLAGFLLQMFVGEGSIAWLLVLVALHVPFMALAISIRRGLNTDEQTLSRLVIACTCCAGLSWAAAPFLLTGLEATRIHDLVVANTVMVSALIARIAMARWTVVLSFAWVSLGGLMLALLISGGQAATGYLTFIAFVLMGLTYVSLVPVENDVDVARTDRMENEASHTGPVTDPTDLAADLAAKQALLASIEAGAELTTEDEKKIQRLEDAGIDSLLGLYNAGNDESAYQFKLAAFYQQHPADFEQVFVKLDAGDREGAIALLEGAASALQDIGAAELSERVRHVPDQLDDPENVDDAIMSCQVRHIALLEGIAVYLAESTGNEE